MVWCSFISSQSKEPECHITNRSTGHQKRTAFGSLRWRSGAGYLSVSHLGRKPSVKHQLKLPAESSQKAPIRRLIKSLSAGINLNREAESGKALELSTYLYSVGDKNQARDLLGSF